MQNNKKLLFFFFTNTYACVFTSQHREHKAEIRTFFLH